MEVKKINIKKTYEGIKWTDKCLQGIYFIKCKFIRCVFTNVKGGTFIGCDKVEHTEK